MTRRAEMRTRCILALPLLLAACVQPGETPGDDDHAAAVARIVTDLRSELAVVGRAAPQSHTLEARMAELEVPGVSVAVAEGGRIAWARGFGLREAATADSVSPTTLFQAASISKPIAATAILRMVEQGELSLDVPVNEYLTSWKLPENDLTAGQPVTLRHLVSHGAGTTVWGFPGYQAGTDLPSVPQILDGQPPANTPAVRVDLAPGHGWRYSGGGVTIAQLAVADVAGEEFSDVMDRLVLTPFGMDHSTFDQPLPRGRSGEAAAGHRDGAALPGRWHTYPELAAAGLWTTPTDLVSWAIEIAEAYLGGSELLSTDLAREMLSRQHGNTGLGPSFGGADDGFFFGHGGANAGFRAQLVYFPQTGQGAAVMTNGEGGAQLNREILLALGTEYGWPDYAEVTQLEQEPTDLDAYLGTFAAEQLPITLTMVREDRGLFVEGEGALGRQEVIFLSPDRAMTLGTGTEIVFERTTGGAVTAVESMGLALARQEPQASDAPSDGGITPPVIDAVVIHPPVAVAFQCSEHPLGQEDHAGDALAADCRVVRNDGGPFGNFPRFHSGEGTRNEDWFSWNEPLLAPFDGVVKAILRNPITNHPGTRGPDPSSAVLFERFGDPSAAPLQVGYVHVQDIQVEVWDTVQVGQFVARIGNNGNSIAPHVHIGAMRGDLTRLMSGEIPPEDVVPLQVRFDLAAMGRLRGYVP